MTGVVAFAVTVIVLSLSAITVVVKGLIGIGKEVSEGDNNDD